MGYAQEANWESLLTFKFDNIVEQNRQFKEDFYKFRKANFEYKIQSSQRYYDVDNICRR